MMVKRKASPLQTPLQTSWGLYREIGSMTGIPNEHLDSLEPAFYAGASSVLSHILPLLEAGELGLLQGRVALLDAEVRARMARGDQPVTRAPKGGRA